jgi:DNA-binding GntR family transcriptional regulator
LKALMERDEKSMRALLEQHLLNKRDAVIEGIKNQQQDITA